MQSPERVSEGRATSRREFLRVLGRGAALAGLGAAAAVLAARTLVRGGACTGNPLCGGCQRLADCRLPRAAAYKQNGKAGPNHE